MKKAYLVSLTLSSLKEYHFVTVQREGDKENILKIEFNYNIKFPSFAPSV